MQQVKLVIVQSMEGKFVRGLQIFDVIRAIQDRLGGKKQPQSHKYHEKKD